MKTIVLDSSVIVKIIKKNEENYDIALKIFEDIYNKRLEVLVPDYWKHEILNISSREMSEIDSFNIFKSIQDTQFKEIFLNDNLVKKILNIVKNCEKIASYDATFHAIAILEKTILITADEKYYKAAKKFGHIMLLKDYK